MSDRETAHAVRGLIARGVVSETKDDAETQTARVDLWKGVTRKDVEVLQPFGVASRPPAGGSAVVLAVGGDQGDLVMLPVGAPGLRLGELEEGEAALYAIDGSRVHAKADGTVEAIATTSVRLEVDGNVLEVNADFIRGRMADGSRFAAGPGWAKLVAGGHHVSVSSAGVKVSVAPVVGPEAGAGV